MSVKENISYAATSKQKVEELLSLMNLEKFSQNLSQKFKRWTSTKSGFSKGFSERTANFTFR